MTRDARPVKREAAEPATQDNIPPTRRERERIRRAVRDRLATERPVPPLSLDELHTLSDEVLAATGLEEKFRGFVVVLLNNEAWRDTLACVPYDRRLLLLPQCLRSQEACRAEIDEFGLICAGCGSCPIDSLKTEAEALGYVVLVAEGVPVVMSLIESGKIEAVVGASCLSALEKIHPLIEAAAVPGVAIPLLRDGCKDTTLDLDWLREAIRLASDPAVDLKSRAPGRIDIDDLRGRIERWFVPESLEAVLGRPGGQTEEVAHAWLAKSGKRWRPFLVACAHQAFRQNAGALPDDLHRVAVAIECFHKASLVHDDIEDHDETRYGEKTLHEQYGIPFALNVGDFLLGEGYRLIAESEAPPERRAEMLRVAARGHRNLCLGQGSELSWTRRPAPLTPDEVIHIFRQKTAPAFEVALRLGAIYAGASEDVWNVLARFSEALGIAYQIRDDLKDWSGESEPTDGFAMRPSILLAIAYERADGPARHLLEAVWRRSLRLDTREEAVKTALAELRVEQAAVDLLNTYRTEAVASLRPLTSTSLKGLLRRVISKIFNDVETGGSLREPQAQDASRGRASAESAA